MEIYMEIVISGMGVVSTAGHNLSEFWKTLEDGMITYCKLKEFDNNKYRYCVGAKIIDEKWRNSIFQTDDKYGRASAYAISATINALKDADIDQNILNGARVALCISTTMGEVDIEEEISLLKGKNRLPPNFNRASLYSADNIARAISEVVLISGPCYTIATACAGGNYALAMAKFLLETDQADIVIAGGVDVFSRVAFTGFQRLLSMSPDVCRPFARDRKGMILGEGCGMIILEKSNNLRRGKEIYGYLLGTGITSDRYHMVSPHPNGDGAVRAMNSALHDAGVSIYDIDYISAHGTGTYLNDKVEAKALETVFGYDNVPPVSSIKSMLGHPMGAASALECIATMLMLNKNIMLPTMNIDNLDPSMNFDVVQNKAKKKKLKYALSNSFAFGGQVGCIVVKGR